MRTPSERLRQQFLSLIVSQQSIASSEPILETILIADGMYFGRKFSRDGYTLKFFAQEEHVKVANPVSEVLFSGSMEQFLAETWTSQLEDNRAA